MAKILPLGNVQKEELQSLLCNAIALAYPSLCEGFGLPVLDALTAGIPVLTSNRSSLPEVAGNTAVLIDPRSTEEITKGLERLLTDISLRNELKEKGKKQAEKFSWQRTVDLMMEAFNRV